MGKIHRFLSVLLMTMCLSAVAFVPFNTMALTQEMCYKDCDKWSAGKIKEIATKTIIGADAEYKEAAGRSYCKTCAQNAKAINEFIRQSAQKEGDDSCVSLCQQNSSSNYRGLCNQTCEDAVKTANDDDALINSCFNLGISFGENIYNQTNIALADSAAQGYKNFGGGFMGVLGIGVGIVDGVIKAFDSFGNLIGDWIPAESQNSGVTFSKILNQFQGENHGCWFCPAYDIIFDIINKTASEMYVSLRDLCLFLLATFAMAWLLWTVFRFITTLHGPNVGEMVTKLFKGLFLIAILAIILRFPPSFITQLVIDPFAELGTKLSREILATRGYQDGVVEYTAYTPTQFQCGNTTIEGASPQVNQIRVCNPKPDNEFEGLALSASVYNGIDCTLRMMSNDLIFGMALGATLVSKSFEDRNIPMFKVLFVGAIIFVAYLMLFISVPLKLIDLLLRLAFVVILLPFFIACMATPATRGYTKKAWEMFLSCWITLISLFLYLTLVLTLLSEILLNTD